jgi:hypothetical protein
LALDLAEHAHGGTSATAAVKAAKTDPKIGTMKYQLRAVVEHLGNDTETGHYVCWVRQRPEASAAATENDPTWMEFDDDTITTHEELPASVHRGSYLLFYERFKPGVRTEATPPTQEVSAPEAVSHATGTGAASGSAKDEAPNTAAWMPSLETMVSKDSTDSHMADTDADATWEDHDVTMEESPSEDEPATTPTASPRPPNPEGRGRKRGLEGGKTPVSSKDR